MEAGGTHRGGLVRCSFSLLHRVLVEEEGELRVRVMDSARGGVGSRGREVRVLLRWAGVGGGGGVWTTSVGVL